MLIWNSFYNYNSYFQPILDITNISKALEFLIFIWASESNVSSWTPIFVQFLLSNPNFEQL